MGQLATNHLVSRIAAFSPLPYARMIPGVGVSTPLRAPVQPNAPGKFARVNKRATGLSRSTMLSRLLLPHPTDELLDLYQAVGADLLILGLAMMGQEYFASSWSFREESLPIFAVLVTLFAFTEGVYRNKSGPLAAGTVTGLARSVLFATLLVFLAEGSGSQVQAIPITLACGLGSLLLYRQLRCLARNGRQQDAERRILLVGAGACGRSVARVLRKDPSHRVVIRGFVDDDLPLSKDVLGRIDDLDWLARSEFIDEVILALPGQPSRTKEAAEAALRNHLDIRVVPELPLGPWFEPKADFPGEVPLLTLHKERLPEAALFLKRLIDVVGSTLALALAAPAMGMVALLIRLESPGPVLYAAERVGAKGSRFRCFKFRSMVTDADHLKEKLRDRNQREGPIFKIVDDPRVTRVGRFIRRYSLDELPQLWNVVRGEMSLVGPRPHPVDEVNHYELHHYRRLDMKPGITGLWQVTARHSPSFDLNMHLDLTYIENWSLRLDLQILVSTARVLFRPEGS